MTVEFTLREVWQQRHIKLFDLESTGSEAHRTKFLCNHRVYSYHKPYGTAFTLLTLSKCRTASSP